MLSKKVIFFIPGLSDQTGLLNYVARTWHKQFGYSTKVRIVPWKDNSQTLRERLDKFHAEIKAVKAKGAQKVILVGTSAAGSFVFNLAYENPNVDFAANICGRLRDGGPNAWPSLNQAARNNPIFKECVLLFESRIPKLTIAQKKRLITIGSWWDGVVPVETIPLEGATNLKTIFLFHPFSIASSLVLYKNDLIKFFDS